MQSADPSTMGTTVMKPRKRTSVGGFGGAGLPAAPDPARTPGPRCAVSGAAEPSLSRAPLTARRAPIAPAGRCGGGFVMKITGVLPTCQMTSPGAWVLCKLAAPITEAATKSVEARAPHLVLRFQKRAAIMIGAIAAKPENAKRTARSKILLGVTRAMR